MRNLILGSLLTLSAFAQTVPTTSAKDSSWERLHLLPEISTFRRVQPTLIHIWNGAEGASKASILLTIRLSMRRNRTPATIES